ncbi:MAG: formylmethanofuran dehydrogenase subunit A [Candidatus Porifericomitaceae bacterium WSBS_2022_MAG_OTU9]
MSKKIIKLQGGRIYDPQNGVDGGVRDLYLQDGKIVPAGKSSNIEHSYKLNGKVVMAGGIDMHTHIGGGKNNLARLLLPEEQQQHGRCATKHSTTCAGSVVPTAGNCGHSYAKMGYTTCFEPAMLPSNARHVHMEFADIPIIDKGAYVLLGNDDFLLQLIAGKEPQQRLQSYVAWALNAYRAQAVKVVNPGGINAFKYNQRQMDLDQENSHYGVSPRQILLALSRAVHDLGLPHPVHLHASNLGAAGNLATTLETIHAVEGLPLHLTHLQFHSYDNKGKRGFCSGAEPLAKLINSRNSISVDIGQVMFGQTITASGDTMRQHALRQHSRPERWLSMDIECDAGCGVQPAMYKDSSFVHALQWAIGLELFLLIDDPWRVFLTTDHPNGAPFASYPQLIHLLMDSSFRAEALKEVHQAVPHYCSLANIKREYSLYEIAVITRAGPARSLGLKEYGHLGVGAVADITVYHDLPDRTNMFAQPAYVFKNGELIAADGEIKKLARGKLHSLQPDYDDEIVPLLERDAYRRRGVRLCNHVVGDEVLQPGAWQTEVDL